MMRRITNWICSYALAGVVAVALGTCLAAILTAPPREGELRNVLKFSSEHRTQAATGPVVTQGIYECGSADDLTACLKQAAASVCGDGERFEVSTAPPTIHNGIPQLAWRCTVRLEKSPVL